MKLFTVQAEWQGYRINSIPVDHVMHVESPPKYPDNHRAFLMSQASRLARENGHNGVWWLTCDIALDPGDVQAMEDAVHESPELVHTGLVKLWPASTGRDTWMWSHRSGKIGAPTATQDETAPVTYFSIDCVWTPVRLLDLAFPRIEGAQWNHIDLRLSEIAAENDIGARVVAGCRPKHLHY